MTREDKRASLQRLFEETGAAHHEAFAASDPDWPLWYADYLKPKLSARGEGPRDGGQLCVELSRAELVSALLQAEDERDATGDARPWAEFYAEYFCGRYVSCSEERLSLYYFPSCPYCRRVLRVIERLGLQDRVELRDITAEPGRRAELLAARGRATVPVLRCTSSEADRWMPESRDIIRYLETRFGSSG